MFHRLVLKGGLGSLHLLSPQAAAALAAEVACWTHVGRKFNDIHVAAGAPIATDSLTRISRLH